MGGTTNQESVVRYLGDSTASVDELMRVQTDTGRVYRVVDSTTCEMVTGVLRNGTVILYRPRA